MKRRSRVFLLAALFVTGVETAAAQSQVNIVTRPEDAVGRAGEWVTAILSHQAGVEDAAVTVVAGWDKAQVDALMVEMASIRALMRDPFVRVFDYPIELDGGRPKEIRYSRRERDALEQAAERARKAGLNDSDLAVRAVVLHTDVARLSGLAGTVFTASDGQELTLEHYRADHWAMARFIANVVNRKAGRDSDLAFWYRATLAYMISVQHWSANHALGALSRFDDDAEVQFLVGCQHEMLAAARMQESLAASRLPAGMDVRVGSRRNELNAAAALFKRTLDRNSAHAEARLRYGRVLAMTGRTAMAIGELRRAAGVLKDAEQRYYAALFLGAALEDMQDRAGATAAYQQASELFPGAQAPRLALSQLAASRGDWAGAGEAIAAVMTRSFEDKSTDPWLTYLVSCGRDANALLIDASRRLMTPRGW